MRERKKVREGERERTITNNNDNVDNITTCTRANNNNNKRQQITEKPKEFYREKLKDHEGIGGGEREGKIKLYGGEKRKRGRDGEKKRLLVEIGNRLTDWVGEKWEETKRCLVLREKGSNKYRTCGYNKTREIEREGKLNIKAKSRWRGKKILEKTFLYSHTHKGKCVLIPLCGKNSNKS